MASACKIPTDAAEDWMMPVKAAPTSTPRKGLVKAVIRPENPGISASGATAPLMSSMPYIRMEKPIMTRPTSRRRCFFEPMISRMPASASKGEKFLGLSLSIPVRDSSHAVSVVPILEPIITPMVCRSSITPEFTRPTSITVIAEEDWMAMVIPAPSKRLLIGLEVMRLSSFSSLPPAIFSRLLDITVMP